MKNKIKTFINSAIIMAAAFAVMGLVFILFPQGSLDTIRWIVAIFFLVAGVYMLARNAGSKHPMFGGTILGAILLIIGTVFAFNPGIMNIFPIILGSWFIISSMSTIRYATALQNSSAKTWSFATSILSIICGLLLIINPWGGQIAMMTFAGIMMLIYSISSLVDLITLKNNIHDVNKKFDKLIEAEIVEKDEEN
ncbi:MAG: DUF308 domain-containing protein [Candidatus Saccharibacteria bacterium]|nr:DUF308 domain-containing protein [Candidatus Saccharibacteria bacterium]